MSASRDDILQELGLWPRWQRRDASGTGALPVANAALRSAGDPPANEPLVQGVHDRGYLPHLNAEGGNYFVTFRLADSLPAAVLKDLEAVPEKQRSRKVEEYLDAGHGECWLGRPEIAAMMKQILLKFDGERYQLHAWIIMPNHVHLLIGPAVGQSLSEVLQGIKSVSAHEGNKLLERDGEFWQKESYDHLIRDDADRARCVEYIAQNPVKAGLAKNAGEYLYSSAFQQAVDAGESPALPKPAPQKQSQQKQTPQKQVAKTAAVTQPLSLDARAAEIAGMDWPALKQCVADCTACPLHKGRHKTVFGVGDEAANWMFVGEGPGAEEDMKGEPFVGQAGKLLDNMLAAIKLKRGENVYIANVVKCRPPNNRNPEPLEVEQCEPYLHRQIELIRPKLIIALGKVAAVNLLKREASVASMRGKIHEYRGTPMIVTYHPAYLLRSLPEKAKAWEDLCFAVETMRGLQSGEPAPT
jgi:DNA polymerase